jgi:hypothetical protein
MAEDVIAEVLVALSESNYQHAYELSGEGFRANQSSDVWETLVSDSQTFQEVVAGYEEVDVCE